MLSYAARDCNDKRILFLMAPGLVKTEFGGPNARLTLGEGIPILVSAVDAPCGRTGLRFFDYLGQTVPWWKTKRPSYGLPVSECQGQSLHAGRKG
ncbi:MAG: hypothetical protein ACLP62_02475 [Acidimicrobiales bacterium]